jgi:hypothetical protein
MRIAVCFSGQIRTGVEASPNLLRFIGELLPHTDFFIHSWDIETKKNYNASRIISKPSKLTQSTIDKIKEIYQPKKIVIENWNTVSENDTVYINGIKLTHLIPPMWYSFGKSVEYKTEYEIENNFEYDYVIKLRPDIIFPKNRCLKTEIQLGNFIDTSNIYIENRQEYIDDNSLFIDDVYFISNSKTMNIAGDYHIQLREKINSVNFSKGWPFNYGFLTHLLKNKLNIIENYQYAEYAKINYKYSIYREECLDISPINDFEKCWLCDDYYFGATQNKPHSGKFFIEDLKITHEIENNIEDINGGKFYYVDELTPKSKTLI